MRRQRYLVLIVHGARAGDERLRAAVTALREAGHRIEVRVTWEHGDASRFAAEAAAAGAHAAVACGGDGTLNEVINGLAGTTLPLGIVPLGTANDFAVQAGIPLDDPAAALDVVLRRRPTGVDVAELNGRRFLNVSTGGVAAEVTTETPSAVKKALGRFAYVLSAVRKLGDLEPFRLRVRGPGFAHDGPCLIFAVGNARRTGGGAQLTPHASVTDGRLDLVLVSEMPGAELAKVALAFRRGEHPEHECVHYAQLRELVIESDRPVPVNVDGEPHLEKMLRYRVHRKAVKLHMATVPGTGEADRRQDDVGESPDGGPDRRR